MTQKYFEVYINTGFEINACLFAWGKHKIDRTSKFSVWVFLRVSTIIKLE